MPSLCSSKPQKLGLKENRKKDENLPGKCKFKINTPLIFESEHLLLGKEQIANRGNEKNFESCNLRFSQNLTLGGKLKFQCHYEERKRRAELRRRKIVQNLKKNYQINVEGFNEDATREIIRKVELLEKEKKEREKRNIDRSVAMITRLLEEQKYKNRGVKSYNLLWRRSLKNAPKTLCIEKKDFDAFETLGVSEMGEQSEISTKKELGLEKSTEIEQDIFKEKAKKSSQEEIIKKLPKCIETVKVEDSSQVEGTVQKPKRPLCISKEKCLESTPKCVVFQDYEKGKVYLQDLRITNIGSETIHCRYLGIVVHKKTEDRFPVGVAVRDNVKLRPGLSCSTKIRLCSQDDTEELQGSVVYETRRRNNPSKYSWFFVKVVCLPVQAVVEGIPLKITFPSLSWCEAINPKNSQLMKKILRIKNSGGKACWCKISNGRPETDTNEEVVEEETEEEDETVSSLAKSDKSGKFWCRNSNFTKSEECFGEGYLPLRDEAIETSRILIDELIDNIFAVFRFCPKYYIKIPPFSTTQIEVRFIPQYKGFHHEIFLLLFENCDNCNERAIEIQGDIKKMPLITEPQMIDLKICVTNSGVYAGTFKIFNESKGPYSVFLKVPSSLKEHAHVHPRTAIILPRNYSDFSVRVYPRVSLARDAPQFYKKDSRILEFPVFIYEANAGACKKDRIKIYVFALITDYCLELSPSCINFGTVTTLETARAELELTNHSLTIQEYGFLNLPKGVRVEPNMGFGRILPKESIKLYLLFSPGEDFTECENSQDCQEFKVAVTSITKYGGFREKLQRDEESVVIWGEDYSYEFTPFDANSFSNDQPLSLHAEESDGFDICEEYSSDEDEEFFLKIEQHEKKIRDFLKEDRDKTSEFSFFKRMDVHARDEVDYSKINLAESLKEIFSETGEFEETDELGGVCGLKDNLHIVNCRAFITQPRCQLSESVIQLPATPCSSFSLYRFRLNAFNQSGDENCSCGFRKVSKNCCGKSSFTGSFEFQYFCPHIKLEPESGFLKAGDSLPITIIFRPEFPAEQLRQKSRIKKAEKLAQQKKTEKETPKIGSKQSKGKPSTLKAKSSEVSYENAIGNIINASLFELENYDLFAGERSLQELISPFYVEARIRCIVKTFQCEDDIAKTEIHEMVLICPAIKPNFIYLGSSQEIKFNKVLIGTRSRMLLQVQNISFERISPSATLLNPVGAFHCPAGVRKVEVDPEHIWQQPLVYAPLESKGIEKQFFEIYYDSTNIFLTISGEGIQPEFKITPNFVCCLLGAKLGVTEELKLEIENLSVLKLNLIIKTEFVKEGPDFAKGEKMEDDIKAKKPSTPVKEESKDSKKAKNFVQFWDEIPEIISSAMEGLVDIQGDLISKVFTLSGVDNNNEVVVPPSGRQQLKIHFTPPLGKSDVTYAVKYILMLEGVSPLKDLLLVGKISKVK